MRDYKYSKVSERPAWLLGIIAAAAIIALTSWMSERDREHRREIARLSATCPPIQSGQELIATVRRDTATGEPGELQCLYTRGQVYGSKSQRKTIATNEVD